MRYRAPIVALAAAASFPSPAHASWDLSFGNDYCAITGEYQDDGSSNVSMVEYVDRTFALFVSNANWSIIEGKEYALSFVFDDMVFSGKATGFVMAGQKGFRIGGKADLAESFEKANRLVILKDEATPVLLVRLNGTMAGMARVRPCVASLRRERDAKTAEQRAIEEKRKVIAADPFYDPADPVGVAVPMGNPTRWATFDDYPVAAMREERGGVTRFKLTVNWDGTVAKCETTASSGHADLDEETCKLVIRRARFNRAPSGSSPRTYENRITWGIPR